MSDMLRGQAKMMDYDAICTFVFKDYKDFAKFMLGRPFYQDSDKDVGRADSAMRQVRPCFKGINAGPRELHDRR
jgi:hypothetical protein